MILLFLLGCTALMNHIEAHIESFHRIVPVDLAVFALPFFALRRSLQSSVCKRWVATAGMGRAGAGGVVSQSSGSASNSA